MPLIISAFGIINNEANVLNTGLILMVISTYNDIDRVLHAPENTSIVIKEPY